MSRAGAGQARNANQQKLWQMPAFSCFFFLAFSLFAFRGLCFLRCLPCFCPRPPLRKTAGYAKHRQGASKTKNLEHPKFCVSTPALRRNRRLFGGGLSRAGAGQTRNANQQKPWQMPAFSCFFFLAFSLFAFRGLCLLCCFLRFCPRPSLRKTAG